MATSQIIEPRVVNGVNLLVLREDTPAYLAQAINQVNLSKEEMVLLLPNGQRAVLGPGTDLGQLCRLVESEEFLTSVKEVCDEKPPS